VPQLFVGNNHPAIVPKESFEAAQREIERRSKLKGGDKKRTRYTNKYPFSGKIFCRNCGAMFKRKSWGTGERKKYVWICRERFDKGPKGCTMDAVGEEKIKEAFVRVANQVIADRDVFIRRMTENVEQVYLVKASTVDVTAIDARLGELRQEMSALVKLNLTAGVNTEIYAEEYKRINGEMEDLQDKRSVVTRAEIVRRETLEKVQEIAKVLRVLDGVLEFDEGMFGTLVERIRVLNMVQVEFVLRAGVVEVL
jgi:site-specific DNA recombinase